MPHSRQPCASWKVARHDKDGEIEAQRDREHAQHTDWQHGEEKVLCVAQKGKRCAIVQKDGRGMCSCEVDIAQGQIEATSWV